MKNNDTGEFELVLGNRQLLSGFFVVVILFAVFFVMGYIVGRNSTPAVHMAGNGEQAAASVQAATDTRSQAPAIPAPAPQNSAAAQPANEKSPSSEEAQPQPTTQPARMPAAKAEAPPVVAAAEPAPGETYLQVIAVLRQPDAETIAHTLKDKGFESKLSPAPNGWTRVLVGPYSDLASLGKAKAELENLGFHPLVKK
jgi:cell division protein FtsN